MAEQAKSAQGTAQSTSLHGPESSAAAVVTSCLQIPVLSPAAGGIHQRQVLQAGSQGWWSRSILDHGALGMQCLRAGIPSAVLKRRMLDKHLQNCTKHFPSPCHSVIYLPSCWSRLFHVWSPSRGDQVQFLKLLLALQAEWLAGSTTRACQRMNHRQAVRDKKIDFGRAEKQAAIVTHHIPPFLHSHTCQLIHIFHSALFSPPCQGDQSNKGRSIRIPS